MYAGCPILWGSKMQTLVALSTTEAEYIALSSALREVIAIQALMKELQDRRFRIPNCTPRVVCRTFEDNRSCIEIATNHKTRARTKHLSVRLHHFCSHMMRISCLIFPHRPASSEEDEVLGKPVAWQACCRSSPAASKSGSPVPWQLRLNLGNHVTGA